MTRETYVRIYIEAKNEAGAYIPGVPLRNLTLSDWERIPEHLRDAVDACEFYRLAPGPADDESED